MKLYHFLQKADAWPGLQPSSSEGQPLLHDILVSLDVLGTTTDRHSITSRLICRRCGHEQELKSIVANSSWHRDDHSTRSSPNLVVDDFQRSSEQASELLATPLSASQESSPDINAMTTPPSWSEPEMVSVCVPYKTLLTNPVQNIGGYAPPSFDKTTTFPLADPTNMDFPFLAPVAPFNNLGIGCL